MLRHRKKGRRGFLRDAAGSAAPQRTGVSQPHRSGHRRLHPGGRSPPGCMCLPVRGWKDWWRVWAVSRVFGAPFSEGMVCGLDAGGVSVEGVGTQERPGRGEFALDGWGEIGLVVLSGVVEEELARPEVGPASLTLIHGDPFATAAVTPARAIQPRPPALGTRVARPASARAPRPASRRRHRRSPSSSPRASLARWVRTRRGRQP